MGKPHAAPPHAAAGACARAALHRIGDVNDVTVFPRFEMMRYWSEQNVFNFDGVAKDERASLAARVYECVASKLADVIRVALR